MQQPFLTGKQPILTGVLFLFLIPITKLYSSIWTQSVIVEFMRNMLRNKHISWVRQSAF